MLQGQGAFCQDHEEDDALPFALEDCIDDGRAAWPDPLAPASGPSAGNGLLASLSSDAAVGALARMLQVCPGLNSLSAISSPSFLLVLLDFFFLS